MMAPMTFTGRRGAPKPPPHIWAEMGEAGRVGDPIRLGLARAAYEAWLIDQGFGPDHHTGNHAPDVWSDR
jgi:hypothetical protein